jgi:very-short-patch-repair endonuclease
MPRMITETVRLLRRNQTSSENILWQILRNRNFEGKKFVRQHPIKVEYQGKIRFFIADFYCHEKKLVIELDGKIHEKQKEYDEYRTFIINQLGIRVYRIKNEELKNLAAVTARIQAFLDK